MSRAAIPAIVIGGWLGAGKTTLVNHLLRHADGRRIAVLVNDFGDVSIDADLIDGERAGEVVALAGGCLCCSYGADLAGTLAGIARRDPAPDVVIIECSGVALPRSVLRTARLAQGIDVEGIVCVVDAEQFAERVDDPYVGDTARAQVEQADLLIVNKTDVGDAARTAARIALLAPGAPIVMAMHGQVEPSIVLGVHPRPREAAALHAYAADAATNRFESTLRTFDGPVDVAALAAELSAPQAGVLRAKGVLEGLDGRRWLLHAVGRRVEIMEADGPAPGTGRLVTIRLWERWLRPDPGRR